MGLSLYEIKKIESIARQQKDGISLAQAALRVGGVHEAVREHAREVLLTDKADYYGDSQGLRSLRWDLTQYFKKRYGAQVSLQQVMVSHGAIGAFAALCAGILKPGDEVVLPEPTYPAYKNTVSAVGGRAIFVPAYVSDNGEPWQLDIDRIHKTITSKTKLLVLANPSNPLGAVLKIEELEKLAHLAEKYGFYLVIDEAYEDHVFTGKFDSAVGLAARFEHVVRLGSFSKNFAMSGWRVGSMVASQKLIDYLVPFQDAFFSCPNQLVQFAASYALSRPDLIKEARDKVQDGYRIAMADLAPLVENGMIANMVNPSAAFFAFFKVPDCQNTIDLVYDMLHAVRVAVVPGIDFGPSFGNYIRLCYARNPEYLRDGIGRLKNYFEKTLPKRVHHQGFEQKTL
ncbi:pyridoxal phosphate-dependent aminotransferase [Candidatus Babeliales bacterium]|nr:pyridoxal phosphate-dependent aminotransferase [Candidatus Babeliales bacterium]